MNFEELVTAATVGVGQRPVTPADLPPPADGYRQVVSDDPAAGVLDAAALLDAADRAAGFLPLAAVLPDPAPDDVAPLLPPLAVDALLVGLERHRSVVPDLLRVAAGHRAPAHLLPTLLVAAQRESALRPGVAGVLGERGHWLAQQQTAWARLFDDHADDVDADPADDDLWRTGTGAERRAWLRAFRAADPTAARDTLAASWRKETGDDRAAFLELLADGLTDADEAFLEAALDDRKASVRDVARELLTRLPRSAYVARVVDRARAAVQVERRALRRRLVVSLPPEPDAAALRDGVPARSGFARLGDGAFRLVHVVSAVPVAAWPDLLGTDPATLVDLPAEQFRPEVHLGWRAATARDGDAGWAPLLLTAAVTLPVSGHDTELAELLPPADRVERALTALRGSPTLVADLAAVPAPWPDRLSQAVAERLSRQCRSQDPPDGSADLLARSVPVDAGAPDRADALRRLADGVRDLPTSTQPVPAWTRELERAADTIDLRRAFHRALEPR